MSFFQELKRRNVFRVAVAYIIVGWLVLQVGDTLVPALHLPQWFNSGIALLLILGFPIAVLFAWAFELTPEGVKLERNVDRSASITDRTGQKLNLSIIVLLSLAVGYFAVDKFVLAPERSLAESAGSAASAPSETSIAVLPFVNMSDDASNEFFADGITEELLNLLAKIPELDVRITIICLPVQGQGHRHSNRGSETQRGTCPRGKRPQGGHQGAHYGTAHPGR